MQAIRLLRPGQFSLGRGHCPACRKRCRFIRLRDDEIAVRCLGCRASPISLSLISALNEWFPGLDRCHVYELSARGRVFDHLNRHAASVTGSEFLDGVAPGDWHDGVQCQDVQALTYPDASFDLCTSTEVLEHVPDDRKAMRELHRVLKPGGMVLFTVPLQIQRPTVERAELTPEGQIRYLHPPEYHRDPIRAHGRVLAFRNYGEDIVDRLLQAGFDQAVIHHPPPLPWRSQRPVIVAGKASSG